MKIVFFVYMRADVLTVPRRILLGQISNLNLTSLQFAFWLCSEVYQ